MHSINAETSCTGYGCTVVTRIKLYSEPNTCATKQYRAFFLDISSAMKISNHHMTIDISKSKQ